MELTFRDLRADEIECRIQQVKENGLVLLLYKDARCDMNMLDETVGAMNWKREHARDNANCIVSIWDSEKAQWVSKEDTGKESNNEAEKGLASDSFKRACFNWGIGRELYTAPFIWIPANMCSIKNTGKKDKFGNSIYTCKDDFTVSSLKIINKRIAQLTVTNEKTGNAVFAWGEKTDEKYICADCGREVRAYGSYSAKQVAGINQKKHGRILCAECSSKLKAV